jgi:hypothetical protein
MYLVTVRTLIAVVLVVEAIQQATLVPTAE